MDYREYCPEFYALIGAAIVNELIANDTAEFITLESTTFKKIILTAVIVLLLSVGTAYLMTARKAKKIGETVWNASSKRLLINFFIPLFTGGDFRDTLIETRYLRIDCTDNFNFLRIGLRQCEQIYFERCTLFRHY